MQVGSLVCLGDYQGDAKASKSIELKSPAKVHGNITTPSLMVERGVFFDGTCKMDGGAAASRRSDGLGYQAPGKEP